MGIPSLTLLATVFICGIFPLTTKASTIFWKKDGVKLTADVIEEATNVHADQCLGVCLQNPKCKSFNLYKGDRNTPLRCEFFAVDKCSLGAKLNLDAEISYYDTLGAKKCKIRKLT